MTTHGADLIAAERQRQIDVEGWTPDHDLQHIDAGVVPPLVAAALCYATPEAFRAAYSHPGPPAGWPWDARFWKPVREDRVRELVKAGALIAAEIDRLRHVDQQAACRDCGAEGFRLTDGRCDGCHAQARGEHEYAGQS